MSQETLTLEQMQQAMADQAALIAKLTRKLESKASGAIKVSEKGAVSVYGLGRFPTTLYASQWVALFERQDDIKDFIADHAQELANKQPSQP